MTEPRTSSDPSCPECGAAVPCGMARGEERCWCADLPSVEPRLEPGRAPACLCERCLRRRIADERDAS